MPSLRIIPSGVVLLALSVSSTFATPPHVAPAQVVTTPWPRVLPCEAFSAVTFEVFAEGGTTSPAPQDLTWTTTAGWPLHYHATRSGPSLVPDPIAIVPAFPGRALSRLALPGPAFADGPHVNVWLQCATKDGAGIEWTCQGNAACKVGVVYPPASAPRWPAALESDGALADRIERLLALTRTHKGQVGHLGPRARSGLTPIVRELALATRAWLDVACAADRCPKHIADAAARLTHFIQAADLRIVRADQREVLDNEHYRAGYPHLELEAEAGAESVSLSWDVAEEWRLGFGKAGAVQVTCDSMRCMADGASVGATLDFQFYHPEGFGILGPPLADPAR